MRAKEFLFELGDKPYTLPKRWQDGEKTVTLPSGKPLSISIIKNDNIALVNFYVDERQENTGTGDAFKIFSTVQNAVLDYIKQKKPEVLVFTANPNRVQLYDKMVRKLEQHPLLKQYKNVTNMKRYWPNDLEYKVDDMQNTEGQKIYVFWRMG